MNSRKKGILSVALLISVIASVQSPAWAVYGDGAGDGGQLRNSSGQPMARVKVKITQQNKDGSETTQETETNRAGIFFLPESGGPVTRIDFVADGKVHTFHGPFDDIPEITGLVPPGASPEDEILDFRLVRADSVSQSKGNGVWVTGKGEDGGSFPRAQFSLTYGYTFGSSETSVSQNGTRTQGDDIDIGQSTIRPDLRFFLGPLGNIGNVGNLGNIGFLGIGNLGRIGLTDCYVGAQGAIGVTGGDEGLNTNQHGVDAQTDTTLKQKFNGALTPYVGCKILTFNESFGYLNLQAGARISFWEYTFSTDESQGGGVFQQVKQNDTKIGPAFGLEYNNYLDFSNIEFLNFLGSDVQGGLQAGIWGELLPGSDISTRTPTFGIDYTASSEDAWVGTARFGIGAVF